MRRKLLIISFVLICAVVFVWILACSMAEARGGGGGSRGGRGGKSSSSGNYNNNYNNNGSYGSGYNNNNGYGNNNYRNYRDTSKPMRYHGNPAVNKGGFY